MNVPQGQSFPSTSSFSDQANATTRKAFQSLWAKAYQPFLLGENKKQYVPSAGHRHLTQGEITIDSVEDSILPVIDMDPKKDVLVDLKLLRVPTVIVLGLRL